MSSNVSSSTRSSVLENNKVVFLISVLIALICWGTVSVYNTSEVERTITGIKVQITDSDELLEKYGLAIFDKTDYFLDVTLKGYSYLLRDITADNIDLTASCASVAAAGTYDLQVSSSLSGSTNNNIKISKLSATSVKVYFDREVSKTFGITADIQEMPGYSIAEGYERENPILSTETVSVTGPSRDVNRITGVSAHIKLNKTLSSTERFEAELKLEYEDGIFDNAMFTFEPEGPVYITVPVNHTGTYDSVVEFKNMPQAYKDSGFEYSVSPSTVDITSMTSVDTEQNLSHQISVGTIDFCDIAPGKINLLPLIFDSGKGPTVYNVKIDTSDMESCSISVPVDISNITLPSNIVVNSAVIDDVTVVCPEDRLAEIDANAVYAVPVTDGFEDNDPGEYSVPAKIVFRTLNDCWVYGKYTISITVR